MDLDLDSIDLARWELQMALHLESVSIAKKVWEDLLDRNAHDEITWLRLGHAYLQLGDNPAAIACLIISKSINRSGKAAIILNNLVKAEIQSLQNVITQTVESFLSKYQIPSLFDMCSRVLQDLSL
jgi:cytochrome c-type biogenesis protein CcmH/NrfG